MPVFLFCNVSIVQEEKWRELRIIRREESGKEVNKHAIDAQVRRK